MLETVFLRELQLEDAQDRYKWMLDSEVTQHLNVPDKYPPFTIEETEKWIDSCINKSNGYIQKAIIVSNIHVGWIDLKNFDHVNKNAELGVAIGNKEYWGKGVGTEAIKQMLRFGFEELDLIKIWLRVDSDNVKAISSYNKIGFMNEGMMRMDRYRKGEFIDRLRMSMLRSEFVNSQV